MWPSFLDKSRKITGCFLLKSARTSPFSGISKTQHFTKLRNHRNLPFQWFLFQLNHPFPAFQWHILYPGVWTWSAATPRCGAANAAVAGERHCSCCAGPTSGVSGPGNGWKLGNVHRENRGKTVEGKNLGPIIRNDFRVISGWWNSVGLVIWSN